MLIAAGSGDPQAGDVKARIEEIEALLVGLLGRELTNVQQPKFGSAREWTPDRAQRLRARQHLPPRRPRGLPQE
jgi:hypothetical protein